MSAVPFQYELIPEGGSQERRPKSVAQINVYWTQRQATAAFLMNLVILFVSICILSVALTRCASPSDRECAQKTSPYSPIWDAVEFWEGNFINYFNHSSPFRGPPTIELERAWYQLWHHHLVPVDSAGVDALNQSQSGSHAEVIGSDPADPSYGGYLTVFHQLHCLNVLRQYTWPLNMFQESWGELYPRFMEDRVGGRMHADHCIETLRLGLMCYSDITPVLFKLDANFWSGAKLDFNVYHKCRNFNKIVEHVVKHGVELP
ncbi:hypothetical protein QQS21_007458 [Conoideocrella luteorostrata]|uniref:Cyclochlorotine biosynthesis protein O n=1 Tax=Conoideocrella luteorostrata TaxID=1105319 RepID=A0AAJ0CKN4_9HYPO|nr:hypothetical protein QQS21_007458 [Conoideocrella luteorostrata]